MGWGRRWGGGIARGWVVWRRQWWKQKEGRERNCGWHIKMNKKFKIKKSQNLKHRRVGF